MLLRGLERYRDVGLVLLRLGFGIFFIYLGIPKVRGGPQMWGGLGAAMGNLGIHFAPTVWGFIASLVEAVGGILLILGLFFRPMCILLTFQMIVALLFHLNSPMPQMQTLQAFEPAMLCGIVFLSLIFMGPGAYSADAAMERRSRKPFA